jgi:rubrerythrin
LTDKEKGWMDIGRKFDGHSVEEIEEALKHIRKRGPVNDSNNPEFPEDGSGDPERRIDAMAEKYRNAEEKAYETRPRRVRASSVSPGDKKTYLENRYTNDKGIMICQICGEEMPFRKKDGGYYYESVELLNNKFFSRENAEQFIALCPECSARYNEFVLQDDSIMKKIKERILNKTELELELGDKTRDDGKQFKKSIRFANKHLIDLQTILRQEQDG